MGGGRLSTKILILSHVCCAEYTNFIFFAFRIEKVQSKAEENNLIFDLALIVEGIREVCHNRTVVYRR